MALPIFIPIAIGVGALIKGGLDTLDAIDRKDRAKKKLESANAAYQQKFGNYKSYHLETERQLQQLGRKRADGMRAIRKAIAFVRPSCKTRK